MIDKASSYVPKQGYSCPDYTWTTYGNYCLIMETWSILPKQGYSCPDYTWTTYGNYCLLKS